MTRNKITEKILDDELVMITDFWASFFISGVLAVTFKTLTAPFERIKLILQTQSSSQQMIKAKKVAYSGFFDAIIRLPREQGFLSLWRGNFTNICRYFPAQAINFSFYDVYYRVFRKVIQPQTIVGYDILSFLAGGSVGLTSSLILYPLTYCMTKLSVDIGDNRTIKREFSSLNDCLFKVYKNKGYRGYYHGVYFSAVGMFLYRSTYFGVYMTGKRIYLNDYSFDPTSHTVNAPFLVSLALAQFASITSTVITYPLDTVARRAMVLSGQTTNRSVSVRQMISKIRKMEGPVGFYKGIFTNFFTTFCGSFVLATYDVFKGYYQRSEKEKVKQK